jgi:hypothetical protein
MRNQNLIQRIKSVTPRPIKRAARVLLIEIPTNLRYYSRLILRGDQSQFGEITVARRLLRPGWPKYVVEVGAFDAKKFSNSYGFICEGWQAVLVEPPPANFAAWPAFMPAIPPCIASRRPVPIQPGNRHYFSTSRPANREA